MGLQEPHGAGAMETTHLSTASTPEVPGRKLLTGTCRAQQDVNKLYIPKRRLHKPGTDPRRRNEQKMSHTYHTLAAQLAMYWVLGLSARSSYSVNRSRGRITYYIGNWVVTDFVVILIRYVGNKPASGPCSPSDRLIRQGRVGPRSVTASVQWHLPNRPASNSRLKAQSLCFKAISHHTHAAWYLVP